MKLIYTEMTYSMTDILVAEARQAASEVTVSFTLLQTLSRLKRKEKY